MQKAPPGMAVRAWAEGKPLAVTALAVEIARGAEAVWEVLKMLRERGRWPVPVQLPDVDEWLGLYRNPQGVGKGMIERLFPPGVTDGAEAADVVKFLDALETLRHTPAAVLKAELEKVAGPDGLVHIAVPPELKPLFEGQVTLDEDLSEDEPEAEVEPNGFLEAISTPEVLFLFKVVLPCWYECGRAPGIVYRAARLGDMASLETLLRIDKAVVRDRRIAQHLLDAALSNRTRFELLGNAFRHGPVRKLTRGKVKCTLAGFVPRYSEFMLARLEEPDIRGLFDALARDEGRGLREGDLPESSEAFQKAIARERQFWQFRSWDRLMGQLRDQKKPTAAVRPPPAAPSDCSATGQK